MSDMSKVGIIGYGITPFTKKDQKIESVLLDSAKQLFRNNSQINREDIDAVLVSTNNNSKYLSPILSEMTGIQPKISHSVESLCNSGTNSLVSAYSYIASGLANMVLVTGAERYDSPGQILQWDNSRGEFKHPIFWASIFTKSYKREFSISDEQLAIVSVKNHKQAKENPNALSNKTYTVDDVMNSKKLTEDLRLLDCSRPCTGSASIIMASEEKAIKTYYKLLGFNELVTEANSMVVEISNKEMNDDLAMRSKNIIKELKSRSSKINPILADVFSQISQNLEKNISLLTN